MKNDKGFSFTVLLLVVIIIFGIFIFLAPKDKEESESNIENASTADKVIKVNELAKDVQRKSDLDTIEKALQLALMDGQIELINTSGCNDCNSIKGSNAIDGSGWIKFKIVSGEKGLEKYYSGQKLNIDPDNKNDLFYSYYSDGDKFELNAKLTSNESKDEMKNDRGNNDNVYEIGTSLFLIN